MNFNNRESKIKIGPPYCTVHCTHVAAHVDVVARVDVVAQVDVVAHWYIAHQTSGAEVPGSKPASTTMILMRCRIVEK